MDDSVKVLPKVREEANFWRISAISNGRAADSLEVANNQALGAVADTKSALAGQVVLTTNERVQKEEYKSKAQRRGFVLWVLVAVDVAVTVLLITH